MRATFIDPGRFRHELVLETPQNSADGLGGHFETWTEAGVVMADIEAARPKRQDGADQDRATAGFRITMRFRPDIRIGMRLRRGVRIFAIGTVSDPDESGRYLVCQAVEVTP